MKVRSIHLRPIWAGLAALLIAAPAAAEKAPPTAEMQQVFEAVSELVPLSMSERQWASPEKRAEILKWLDALAQRSVLLEKHAEGRDATFRHLSRSLSADIEEIRERFRRGRYEESRFFMLQATGNCVACHSRLPSGGREPMADRLLDRIDFDETSAHEKTQILVATRQFEKALDVWEETFADKSIPPGELDLGGYLLSYLTVGLRVVGDPMRVQATFSKLAERDDVPLYLRRHLLGWIEALGLAGGDLGRADRLGRARQLISGKGLPVPAPLGRQQIVYDLIASSLLLQFLDEGKAGRLEQAEAYYLLGLVESRTVDSHWVPQAELHLETSIRMVPDAPFAEDAYAALEEYVVIGWGGASSTDLPADVWARLRELRRLIDEKAAAPADEATR